MTRKALRADVLLLITAAIWGFAFVAQRLSMAAIGPFAFNAIRFGIGGLSLLPLMWITSRSPSPDRKPRLSAVLGGGAVAGTVLFLGATLQQTGLVTTTAGKAGFITGLYVILVPLLGLLARHRASRATWAGALLAVAGLYLLSIADKLMLERGDALVLIGALFWALHVLLISYLTRRLPPVQLACVQFLVCAALSGAMALATETTTWQGMERALWPILYGGLLSVGTAYTLQVVAQRDAPPAHAALLMSLESPFAALGGWLVLGEQLTSRGLIGCGLMLGGMLLSSIPDAQRAPDPEPPTLR